MNNDRLKIIGYWHSLSEPDFPDPANFIEDPIDESVKECTLTYLRAGIKTNAIYLGSSWCRFRCGNQNLGSAEYTDGQYVWPEGLQHYIEHHNLRLPQIIVDKILNVPIPKTVDIDENKLLEIDYEWWKNQKGWNNKRISFRDLNDIGLLTVKQVDISKVDDQKIVLKEFLFKANGISQKLRQIQNILAGDKVILKGRFVNYDSFRKKAESVGLQTEFNELTYDQYNKHIST